MGSIDMSARIIGPLALLIVAVAGCGGDNGREPTIHPPYAGESASEGSVNAPLLPSPSGVAPGAVKKGAVPVVPRTSTPPGKKAPAPATAAPPPPPDNLDLCKARHLMIRVVHQPTADLGATSALVTITNTGVSTCALTGWPTVALTRNGLDVGVPTTNVSEPGPPVGMGLSAGRSAFAGLRWKGCAPTAITCRTGSGLLIGAPGADPVQAKLLGFPSKQLRMGALQIGAIQPTTTNIVDW
jgi:hypothetical protein